MGPCSTYVESDILAGHFGGHFFDVLLSLDVNAGDTGEIDDGEIGSVGGVDAELDGIVDDLTALAGNLVR